MNFVRQISSSDRRARDVSLKRTFDFEGWLAMLETSASESGGRDTGTDISLNVQNSGESVDLLASLTNDDLQALNSPFDMSGLTNNDVFAELTWISGGNLGWQYD